MTNPNPNRGGWIAVAIFCLLFTVGALSALPEPTPGAQAATASTPRLANGHHSKLALHQDTLEHRNLTPDVLLQAYQTPCSFVPPQDF